MIVYAAEILSSVYRAIGCLLAGMTAHARFHANNRMQHDNGCNGVYLHAWANGLCEGGYVCTSVCVCMSFVFGKACC